MRISVIIPSYRRAHYLRDSLSSVASQNYPTFDYEVLVVDNAPEPIPALVCLHDQCSNVAINYIHEPRNGLHNARHAGARQARGEILVYIDDDVICPPGWLTAMVAPYDNERVAMVAGKVVLRYEADPPDWAQQFSELFSAHDLGNDPRPIAPYGSAVGCNMSVRRSVLFAVGGFNPDGFGDRSLIHLRGDGEVGLARKIHDAGHLVWYAPEAWLEHRVPAGRMTLEYVVWRSTIGGIENAYADLRYHERTIPALVIRMAKSILRCLYHYARAYLPCCNRSSRFRHLALASRYKHRGWQHLRQILSEHLRRHTLQSSYM